MSSSVRDAGRCGLMCECGSIRGIRHISANNSRTSESDCMLQLPGKGLLRKRLYWAQLNWAQFPPHPNPPPPGGREKKAPSPLVGEGEKGSLPPGGGGRKRLPPPWWGREKKAPSPLVGEGEKGSLPPGGGGRKRLPPPWWGRVGVGGEREKNVRSPRAQYTSLCFSEATGHDLDEGYLDNFCRSQSAHRSRFRDPYKTSATKSVRFIVENSGDFICHRIRSTASKWFCPIALMLAQVPFS